MTYEESRSCKASLTGLRVPMSGETCGRVTSACPGGCSASRCRARWPRSCGRHTRGDDAAMPRLPGPGQPNKRSAPPHPGPQRGMSQLSILNLWTFAFATWDFVWDIGSSFLFSNRYILPDDQTIPEMNNTEWRWILYIFISTLNYIYRINKLDIDR